MPISTSRDANFVPAIFGVSSVDLKTPTAIKVNPATGAMFIDSASLYSGLDTRYILKGGDTVSGNYTFSGHLAFGSGGSVSTDNILNITETLNDSSHDVFGLNLSLTATAATTHQSIGLQFISLSNLVSGTISTLGGMFGGSQTGGGENITTMFGGSFAPVHAGTGVVTNLFGLESVAKVSGTGNVTNAYGGYFALNNTNTSVFTQGIGIYIDSPTNSGGGSITIAYGLKIGDQSAGGVNYSIYTGAGQNFFGDSVNIPYGSYFGVNRGESWPSGTHKLIEVTFTSTDQTNIYTPGSGRSTPMLSLGANASLSFFNHALSSQQSSTGATGYADSGATVVHSAGTFTGGSGSTAYTIGDIVLALKNYGLLVA